MQIYNEAFDPDVMMKNFKNRQGAFEQVFTKAELKTMDDNQTTKISNYCIARSILYETPLSRNPTM